ncbi:MAG TPA: nucleotidyl transferase AbiEii/AbiGii toxin family protein, partial [Opitutaceae bacterium]|nr:nucleotidyl transferase AbiEii/AbiGii toxin family protein [Opitutaceae bacterium]
ASAAGIVIKEDADYEGVRVTFRGSLQNMPIPMQIDIGFGDVIFPEATVTEYPVILNHTPPKLRSYRRETTVAEKFEAMVKLGLLNSRMKDFFDIWLLSRQFDFDGATLAEAIRRTFANRGTTVTDEPTAFTTEFATDSGKVAQWQAFVRRLRVNQSTPDLAGVCKTVSEFLSPPAAALSAGRPFRGIWRSGGPWTESGRGEFARF